MRIPWQFHDIDKHFYPPEEYQVSRVGINEFTGKEEVFHYSYGDLENGDAYKSFYEDYLADI